jgi:SAM-dependent methyltransferase
MRLPYTRDEETQRLTEATRTVSYGQGYDPTLVDRFGVWLSARQIRKWVPSFRDKSIGDFGCGYHAPFVRSILPEVESAVLADVSLSGDLKGDGKIVALEGVLPHVLYGLREESLDVVMCVSVLEHLWEPLDSLREFHRIIKPGGVCLFNVPSWTGKFFLEFSAFRLGLSPAEEMNDHKMYYDPKDLWPLLVRAGFLPGDIRCFRHKFGLNTFVVCRKA